MPAPGSPEGRLALVRGYGDALYRWAWARTGGDAEAAGELVQRVFLSAFERAASYDPTRGEPWGWLVGLAMNSLKALRRERSRHLSLESEPAAGEAPPEGLAREEDRRRVRLALTGLAPGMQRLLEGHYLRGESVEWMAQTMRISPSTAWARLAEAREALRKALGEIGGLDD